ncbi:MAG: hypothetical protein U0133_00835 [Gemmatimonadales bacterium]
MITLERALLTGLVDYAGLFPPAGLGMAETVANYAAYRARPDAWALARLVVPVARLGEFESAFAGLSSRPDAPRWELSALAGNDLAADAAAIRDFNATHAGAVAVTAVELRLATPEQAAQVAPLLALGIEVYCELPLSAQLPALVAAVKRGAARAKVRTGGIKPGDIPAAEAVLAFLSACASERLAFKATAGLHHPVRGPAPLTYEPGSACATMFGYLNLVLAAAVLWGGGREERALTLLTATRDLPLTFAPDGVTWAGIRVSTEQIARARREFLLAIGSCSFTEPLGEIAQVGLDPLRGVVTPSARSIA